MIHVIMIHFHYFKNSYLSIISYFVFFDSINHFINLILHFAFFDFFNFHFCLYFYSYIIYNFYTYCLHFEKRLSLFVHVFVEASFKACYSNYNLILFLFLINFFLLILSIEFYFYLKDTLCDYFLLFAFNLIELLHFLTYYYFDEVVNDLT